MTDPLVDPDDPETLSPQAARALAERVEAAQLAAGAVRYGRVGRVGCARVVLNKESPLPTGCFAVGLDGTSATVGHTLLALEESFAASGRAEAVVHASPTTVPEIEGIADDAGWFAITESVLTVSLTEVAVGGPDHPVRPAQDTDLDGIAELLADLVELPPDGAPSLRRLLGHRLDDPATRVLVVDDGDRLGGVAVGRAAAGDRVGALGLIEHVVVRPARRRRGIGIALVAALTDDLRDAGCAVVAAQVVEAAAEEALAQVCGFVAAYPVTTYVRRVDEEAGFGEE